MAGRLFERFVCRVGGVPAALADQLQAPAAAALLDRLAALEERLAGLRESLSEKLHAAIGGNEDQAARRRLLALRRQLHNGRPPDAEALASLPPPLAAELREWTAIEAERAAAEQRLPEVFAAETAESRAALRRHFGDVDFQRGVLISSRSLFASLPRYLAAGASLSSKDRQIERGLLRYWTRMALKATPFSTFCSVLPGRIARRGPPAAGGPPLRLAGDAHRKKSQIRLNKAFLTVFDFYFRREPELRRLFEVELNPTLGTEAGQLRFLAVAGPREIFQRLPEHPVISLIAGLLRSLSPRPTLGRLLEILAADPELGASEEEILPFVDRLLEIGLLRLTFGIPAQDLDWDLDFRRRMAGAAAAEPACRFLAEARALSDAYGAAPVAERGRLLEQLEENFAAFRRDHDVQMRVRAPLYEDAGADAEAVVAAADLELIERDLAEYVERTAALAVVRRDIQLMRHFFDRHYGGAREVPLLRFYEDFYREVFKRHIEQERRAARGEAPEDGYDLANPLRLEMHERRSRARQALATLTAERWEEARQKGGAIHLSTADLDRVLDGIGLPARDTGWSVSIYADLFRGEDGEPGAVVRNGAYFFGYGKFFSRFLYLFPGDFETDLRRQNQLLSPFTLAEINDDANFNPNLHPPMMAEEVRYPATEPRATGSGLLPSELVVRPDGADEQGLLLFHPASGRRILPVDTGFISFDARPPLYRLLGAFTPAPSFAFQLPEGAGTEAARPDRICERPRVVYNGRLVLYRRAFLVPGALFPRKEAKESELGYFRRIDAWRRRHGIPVQVYARLQPLVGKEAVPDNETSKPQFVDFTAPLLVELFASLAPERGEFMVVIEERLPGAADLAATPGGGAVTELVMQLDFPGEPGPGGAAEMARTALAAEV